MKVNMKRVVKIGALAVTPMILSGCAWALHTTSCVVTLTVVC